MACGPRHLNSFMRKTIALLFSLTFVMTTVHAQAQFEKDDPFKPVVGRWKTDKARFSSITNEAEYMKRNSNWTGKMFGIIQPSGQILFKVENGCILSGLASPFASAGLWAVNGQLENCTLAHFNQKIFGNIRREGPEVILEASALPFTVGRPAVGYYIKTRMVQY